METIKIKTFTKDMETQYKAGNPVIAIGLPGVGKTEVILAKSREILAEETFKFTDEYKESLSNPLKNSKEIEIAVEMMREPKHTAVEVAQTMKAMKDEFDVLAEFLSEEEKTTKKEELKLKLEAVQAKMSAPKYTEEEIQQYIEKYSKPTFTKAEITKAEKELHLKSLFHIDMSGIPDEGLVMPYLDNNASDGQRLKRDLIAEMKGLREFLEITSEGRAQFFVDELTSASQDDQRTLMNFIQGGILPDGSRIDLNRVSFILAGNPSADMPGYEDYDGATNPIENAVITRAAVYFVEASVQEFIEWAEQGDVNGNSNIHPYITAVLKKDPALFMKKDEKDVRILNSRTASKLSKYFYAASDQRVKWQRHTIKAHLGDEVGNTVSSIIDKLDKLVGLQDLFGSDKSKTLQADALDKFKDLSDFEKFYIMSSALDEASTIRFTKKNNVIKFKQLISDEDTTDEMRLAMARRIIQADKDAKGSNASALLSSKWIAEDETNLQGYLVNVKILTNAIN